MSVVIQYHFYVFDKSLVECVKRIVFRRTRTVGALSDLRSVRRPKAVRFTVSVTQSARRAARSARAAVHH